MRNPTRLTRRDMPAFCLIYAVIFGLAAVSLPFAAKLDMAQKGELRSVTGIVQHARRTSSAKGGSKLEIFVRDSNRVHHLTQEDLTWDVPALRSLRAGDDLTALVRRDFLGRDLEWFWEIQRDGTTILSYEQTQRVLEQTLERTKAIAHWAGALSIGILGIAVLLRMHFGAWRNGMSRSGRPTAQSISNA